MATLQEIRRMRLENDYKEMRNIRGDIIAFEANGNPPDEYLLTVKVRAIIGPTPDYRMKHELRITVPANYPTAAPSIVMLTRPVTYHPNWWPEGKWCFGSWDFSEGLGHHVIRMIRTLQYDPQITNEDSPASREASAWYVKNRERGYFPCDRQILPDPTKSLFRIQSPAKKFVVR